MEYPQVVMVNDHPETIFNQTDFGRLIEQSMGHEAHRYFLDLMDEWSEQIEHMHEELYGEQCLTDDFKNKLDDTKVDLLHICNKFEDLTNRLQRIAYDI